MPARKNGSNHFHNGCPYRGLILVRNLQRHIHRSCDRTPGGKVQEVVGVNGYVVVYERFSRRNVPPFDQRSPVQAYAKRLVDHLGDFF